MTQSDDDLKATILARRARFIALALSASGLTASSLTACGGKTSDGTGEAQPAQSTSPSNTGVPPRPSVCLSIAQSSSPPDASMMPTTTPPDTTSTTTAIPRPSVCLSIAPTPCLEPEVPEVPVPIHDAGAPEPYPTACLSPIYVPVETEEPLPPVADAGPAQPMAKDAGSADAGDASTAPVPTPCLSIALPLDASQASSKVR